MPETTVNLTWHTEKIITMATEANMRAMQEAALMVEAQVKKNLSHVGDNLQYRKGVNGDIIHWSSRPGMFPALDTGVLRAGISHEVYRRGNEIVGRITSAAPYSVALELGTSKVAARPFLRPTLRACRKKIVEIFQKHYRAGGNKPLR